MTAEQKQRAADLLAAWRATAYALHADRMVALLQELVDAPEAEPVAWVLGYYAGYLSIATVDGRGLPTGTALYTAPPAPSLLDDVARDAERYRWLTANHASAETRSDVNNISSSIRVRSYAATSAAIDAAIEREILGGGNG